MPSPKPSDVKRLNPFGNDSVKPVITLNLKYGRMYFSMFAIKALRLDEGFFRIFKSGSQWYLMKTDSSTDLRMKEHEHAYYIVCNPLVRALVKHFRHEILSLWIDGIERKRKYYPLSFYVPEFTKVRKAYGSSKLDPKWKDPKIASAERTLLKFETTNFAGRVKTNDVLRAEKLLNTPGRASESPV